MSICPVPISQRPIEEFKQLSNSWFFRWPTKSKNNLYKNLLLSWLIIFPIICIVETGSFSLRNDPYRLISLSIIISFLFPILILIRMIIGWNYIFKRLVSEKIEYEESGWYDGQTWEKPLDWREKDILVAQYEVKPIIDISIDMFKLILIIAGIGSLIYINI